LIFSTFSQRAVPQRGSFLKQIDTGRPPQAGKLGKPRSGARVVYVEKQLKVLLKPPDKLRNCPLLRAKNRYLSGDAFGDAIFIKKSAADLVISREEVGQYGIERDVGATEVLYQVGRRTAADGASASANLKAIAIHLQHLFRAAPPGKA
jgi:hypothetical protein